MFRSESVGICRRFYVTSRGYVERPASFAPPLVDMSNAPPASLRLSWIRRTLRQLRSAKRGKIDGPTPVYRRFGRGFSGHRLTARRRYQTKEHEQLLCNGVTKQKNASNYFATAFSRHSL